MIGSELKEFYKEMSGFGIQMLLSFCFGILFSPWTLSLLYTLLFFIIYEIVIYFFSIKYSLIERVIILVFYFLGYVFGRIISNQNIIP